MSFSAIGLKREKAKEELLKVIRGPAGRRVRVEPALIVEAALRYLYDVRKPRLTAKQALKLLYATDFEIELVLELLRRGRMEGVDADRSKQVTICSYVISEIAAAAVNGKPHLMVPLRDFLAARELYRSASTITDWVPEDIKKYMSPRAVKSEQSAA